MCCLIDDGKEAGGLRSRMCDFLMCDFSMNQRALGTRFMVRMPLEIRNLVFFAKEDIFAACVISAR